MLDGQPRDRCGQVVGIADAEIIQYVAGDDVDRDGYVLHVLGALLSRNDNFLKHGLLGLCPVGANGQKHGSHSGASAGEVQRFHRVALRKVNRGAPGLWRREEFYSVEKRKDIGVGAKFPGADFQLGDGCFYTTVRAL